MFKVIEGIRYDGGPAGRAFGGGIYSASCTNGFSGTASKITLNIVAEDLQTLKNNINNNILRVGGAVEGAAVAGHTIQVGSVTFSNMYIFNYSYNITSQAKTASVTFIDWSQCLDKIQVGLVGRHDTQHVNRNWPVAHPGPDEVTGQPVTNHWFLKIETVQFRVICLECNSLFPRRLLWPCHGPVANGGAGGAAFGLPDCIQPAMPGVGGHPAGPLPLDSGMYEGFPGPCGFGGHPPCPPGFAPPGNLMGKGFGANPWGRVNRAIAVAGDAGQGFWVSPNLKTGNPLSAVNGGYITIGREQFTETNCEVAKIEYLYDDLCNVMDSILGVNQHNMRDYRLRACSPDMDDGACYQANYTGTLREVLTSWFADMSLDFVLHSTRADGLPYLHVIDLTVPADLQRVRDALDTSFDGSNKGLVRQYSTNVTLENTYEVEPIVKYIKPSRTIERTQKHDAYREGRAITVRDAIGDVALLGRSYQELYMSAALAKYQTQARMIWLSDQASNQRERRAWYKNDQGQNRPMPGGPIGFTKNYAGTAIYNNGGMAIKSGAFVSLGFFPIETLEQNLLRPDKPNEQPLMAGQYKGKVHTKDKNGNQIATLGPGYLSQFNTPFAMQLHTVANGFGNNVVGEGDECRGWFGGYGPPGAPGFPGAANEFTYWCSGESSTPPGGFIPGGGTWPAANPIALPHNFRLAAYEVKHKMMVLFKQQMQGAKKSHIQHPIWQNPEGYEVWIGIYNREYQEAVGRYDAELANDFIGKYGMFNEQTPQSYNYCPDWASPTGPHKYHHVALDVHTIPNSQVYSGHGYPFKGILRVNQGQFNPDVVGLNPSTYLPGGEGEGEATLPAGAKPWRRTQGTDGADVKRETRDELGNVLGQTKGKAIFDIDDNAWGTAQGNVDWAFENPFVVGHVDPNFGGNLTRNINTSDLENFMPIYAYWDGKREMRNHLSKIWKNFDKFAMRGSGAYSGYRGGVAIIPKMTATRNTGDGNKLIATGFNGKPILEVRWGDNDPNNAASYHQYNWAADLAAGNINNPFMRHLPGGDAAFRYCAADSRNRVVGGAGVSPGGNRGLGLDMRFPANVTQCHNIFLGGFILNGPHYPYWGQNVERQTVIPGQNADATNPHTYHPRAGTAPVAGGTLCDNPVGGMLISRVETNPVVFKNARRRALERFANSEPKEECQMYCDENIIQDVCECEPYEEPDHGFLKYKGYTMMLRHLGRYVKIIFPLEGTYSGYFTAQTTTRNTIQKKIKTLGHASNNPGNVMGTRVTEVDATPDINAIEENADSFHEVVVARTPAGDLQLQNFNDYYTYMSMLALDQHLPTETINVRVDGTDFAALGGNIPPGSPNLLAPEYGLTSFSISLDGDGVVSELTFADRPPRLPKRDLLMSRVGPRITDGRNHPNPVGMRNRDPQGGINVGV